MTATKRARTLEGRVVSNKPNKSITVLVERTIQHKMYKKIMRRTKKYHVHDENNIANEGDWVKIAECRPMSKTKTWMLDSVLQAAQQEV